MSQLDTLLSFKISQLYSFPISQESFIESVKEHLDMSEYCRIHLTAKNYGMTGLNGPLQGGFLHMSEKLSERYSLPQAVAVVRDLAVKTDTAGLRLGTPLEALLYAKQKLPHPDYFASLAKVWNNVVLRWRDQGGVKGFNLGSLGDPDCAIFVVKKP